jgi:hypothetical protein
MRGEGVVVADRFFPSTPLCSCGAITGPKGREELQAPWLNRELKQTHICAHLGKQFEVGSKEAWHKAAGREFCG